MFFVIIYVSTGTGAITKSELKHFYTAFMDVGKLGDTDLDDLTTKSFSSLTSVSAKYDVNPNRRSEIALGM